MTRSIAKFSAVFLLGCSIPAFGQLAIGVTLNRDSYVEFEPILAEVTIRNVSGNTLDFRPGTNGAKPGVAPGFLKFEITDNNGKKSELLAPPFNPAIGLLLTAGATSSRHVQINEHYGVTSAGHYRIMVRVGHRRFGTDYASPDTPFRVQRAVALRNLDGKPLLRTVGVPGKDPDAPIQTRDCELFYFSSKGGTICGLRISDKKAIHAVVRLGPLLRGAQPQLQVDSRSLLHILLDIGPRLAAYWVFGLDGTQKQKSYYRMDKENLPYLQRDPDLGRVMVVGGVPAVAGVDYELTPAPFMPAMPPPPGGKDLKDN